MVIQTTQKGTNEPQSTSNPEVAKRNGSQVRNANVQAIESGEHINPLAVEANLKLLQESSKQTAGIQRVLFGIMRSCVDMDIFLASCLNAERTFAKNMGAQMTDDEIAKFGRIKSVGDVAKINGLSKLPAVQMKDRFKQIVDGSVEYNRHVQDWLDWMTKNKGEPEAVVPDGFLDPWSERYGSEVKGHQAFMRDWRYAEYCKKRLAGENNRAAKDRPPAGAPANDNGSTVQQALAGHGTGTRQGGVVLAGAVNDALNKLISTIHEVHTELPEKALVAYLLECDWHIWKDVDAVRAAKREEIAQAGNKPTDAAKVAKASAEQDAEEKERRKAMSQLPDVDAADPDPAAGELDEKDAAVLRAAELEEERTGASGENAATRTG